VELGDVYRIGRQEHAGSHRTIQPVTHPFFVCLFTIEPTHLGLRGCGALACVIECTFVLLLTADLFFGEESPYVLTEIAFRPTARIQNARHRRGITHEVWHSLETRFFHYSHKASEMIVSVLPDLYDFEIRKFLDEVVEHLRFPIQSPASATGLEVDLIEPQPYGSEQLCDSGSQTGFCRPSGHENYVRTRIRNAICSRRNCAIDPHDVRINDTGRSQRLECVIPHADVALPIIRMHRTLEQGRIEVKDV